MELTQEEMQVVRDFNNARNRSWWHSMTPEQRKAKRLEYQLRAARKALEQQKQEG